MKPLLPFLVLALLGFVVVALLLPPKTTPTEAAIHLPSVPSAASATSTPSHAPEPKQSRSTLIVPNSIQAPEDKTQPAPTGSIVGHVVDSLGRIQQDATVLVFAKGELLQSLKLQPPTFEFRISLPSNHTYGLLVDPHSLPSGLLPPLVHPRQPSLSGQNFDPLDLDFFAQSMVSVVANQTTQLELPVALPASVQGRVLDAQGFPVPKVLVQLECLDASRSNLFLQAVTDTNGIFSCNEVFPGPYRLLLFLDEVDESQHPGAAPPPLDVSIEAANLFDFGDLYLDPGSQSISGRILNQDGEAFPNLPVLCYSNQRVEAGLKPHNFSSVLAHTTTNQDGFFQLDGLAAIPVKISLTPNFKPGPARGPGFPAIWEPNIEVDLSQHPGHIDLGVYTVEESRPFFLSGNLQLDASWAQNHNYHDVRLLLSQVESAQLAEGIRRNPIQNLLLRPNPENGHFQYAIETPMTDLVLEVRIPHYQPLRIAIHPEAEQSVVHQIQVPSDFVH